MSALSTYHGLSCGWKRLVLVVMLRGWRHEVLVSRLCIVLLLGVRNNIILVCIIVCSVL